MEKFYTVKEVVELLRVSKQTIYNWQHRNKIKITYLNGIPRISESEINRIVKGE